MKINTTEHIYIRLDEGGENETEEEKGFIFAFVGRRRVASRRVALKYTLGSMREESWNHL